MNKPSIPDWAGLGFAFVETDAFFRVHGETGRDPVWDEGEFLPLGPITLSPAWPRSSATGWGSSRA